MIPEALENNGKAAPVQESNMTVTTRVLVATSKTELPIFREDVGGWTSGMEREFHMHKMPYIEKTEQLMNYLEGFVLQGFIWMEDRFTFWDWNKFKLQSNKFKLQVEHAIKLHTGIQPFYLCPYWYPHEQQDEIEKLVKEFLEAELVCPSHSPLTSLVL